jgi:hypothetical protein
MGVRFSAFELYFAGAVSSSYLQHPDMGALKLLTKLHKALQALTKLPQQACQA